MHNEQPPAPTMARGFNDEELAQVRETMQQVAHHADLLARRTHDFTRGRFLVELQLLRARTNDLERTLLDERLR